jgi:Oxidoreductase molybdopterin binding domain
MPSRGRVLVSGCDPTASRAGTSVPGASWVFTTDDLDRTGAFLAVAMNGAPLPTNHGAPIRLVVPGWYGCASIKWVNRIDFVNDEAPATSQMKEFASRTHQNGVPTLARDYEPPAIDPAAMPVRVEKLSAEQRMFYRVIGIQWGGPRPAGKLLIRFRHTEPWTPVDDCPTPASAATWTLWSHTWRPTQPGRYDIVLKAADTSIRTRRLDLYFYTRAVTIADVSG